MYSGISIQLIVSLVASLFPQIEKVIVKTTDQLIELVWGLCLQRSALATIVVQNLLV